MPDITDNAKLNYDALIYRASNNISHPVLSRTCLRMLEENQHVYFAGYDLDQSHYPVSIAEHTNSIYMVCVRMYELFKNEIPDLSADLIRFGAILHDIGKVFNWQIDSSGTALIEEPVGSACAVYPVLVGEFSKEETTKDDMSLIIAQCLHVVASNEPVMREAIIIQMADKLWERINMSTVVSKDTEKRVLRAVESLQ